MVISNWILRFIIFAILLTPLFSSYELFALFSGDTLDQTTALTPVLIKGIKDMLIILICALSVVIALRRKKITPAFFIAILLFLYIGVLFFKTYPENPL